jgi:hypothetical protein
MAEMVVLHRVVVVRDGKRVEPKIGEPFDFTEEEMETLREAEPAPVREVVREGETPPPQTAPVLSLSQRQGGQGRSGPPTPREESTPRDGRTARRGAIKGNPPPGAPDEEETL